MSNTLNRLTIGDTGLALDIKTAQRGDWRWSFDMFDVDEAGVETATDLTGCSFDMVILERDGVTEKHTVSGVISGNSVTITINKAVYADWIANCAYPYYLTFTDATAFDKVLYEGTFTVTKNA